MDHDSELYSPEQRSQWETTFDPKLKLPSYSDAYSYTEKNVVNAKVLAIKTERERDIDIGRDYRYRPMEMGECYMTQEHGLRYAKLAKIGFLRIHVTHMINQMADKYNKLIAKPQNLQEVPTDAIAL